MQAGGILNLTANKNDKGDKPSRDEIAKEAGEFIDTLPSDDNGAVASMDQIDDYTKCFDFAAEEIYKLMMTDSSQRFLNSAEFR